MWSFFLFAGAISFILVCTGGMKFACCSGAPVVLVVVGGTGCANWSIVRHLVQIVARSDGRQGIFALSKLQCRAPSTAW